VKTAQNLHCTVDLNSAVNFRGLAACNLVTAARVSVVIATVFKVKTTFMSSPNKVSYQLLGC
jgi:hypothetical protein